MRTDKNEDIISGYKKLLEEQRLLARDWKYMYWDIKAERDALLAEVRKLEARKDERTGMDQSE